MSYASKCVLTRSVREQSIKVVRVEIKNSFVVFITKQLVSERVHTSAFQVVYAGMKNLMLVYAGI